MQTSCNFRRVGRPCSADSRGGRSLAGHTVHWQYDTLVQKRPHTSAIWVSKIVTIQSVSGGRAAFR